MPEKKILVVKAALISARTTDGQVHHFYGGAALPDGLIKEDVDRLLAEGYIGPDDGSTIPAVAAPPA
jgi:hypothetical protein